MSGTRLRRRLDRITGSGLFGGITLLYDSDYLEVVARRAGVSTKEVVTEALRIDELCRMAGAWTVEARLRVVAADGGVSTESLRAELADPPRTLCRTAT